MRAAIMLDDMTDGIGKKRAWVARVMVSESGYVSREFLRPDAMNYTDENSAGSRGRMKCYWLKPMSFYEVSEPISWRRTDRYFCEVFGGKIIRLTKDEVRDAQARHRG